MREASQPATGSYGRSEQQAEGIIARVEIEAKTLIAEPENAVEELHVNMVDLLAELKRQRHQIHQE